MVWRSGLSFAVLGRARVARQFAGIGYTLAKGILATPLADVEIKKAKSASQPYKMRDEGWLFLLVKPSGSKLWQMGYRFAGKEKTLSIGIYPSVSLIQADQTRYAAACGHTQLLSESEFVTLENGQSPWDV